MTEQELYDLFKDPELLARTSVALSDYGYQIAVAFATNTPPDGTGINTVDHRLWARYVLDNSDVEARRALKLLVLHRRDETVAEIRITNQNQWQNQTEAVCGYLVKARAER